MEPFFPWLLRNVRRLFIYLMAASFILPLFSIAIEGDLGGFSYVDLALLFALYGGIAGVPGTALWLLVVAIIPPEGTTLRRRLVAMAFSPLIQIIWFGVLIENDPLAALVFGILAPAGSAFVVQLRERTRVSSEPTSF